VVRAYRRSVRRSLRWRLAESHVGTVLLSVLAISLLGALATTAAGFLQNPVGQEPATEARWVAKALADLGWTDEQAVREGKTSALLAAMATGKVGPNVLDNDVNLIAVTGKNLANISSISIVGPDLTILASSDPLLIGRYALLIGPTALGVAQHALDGSASTQENSSIVPGIDAITGAYPLSADGDQATAKSEIVGAVVVDKSAQSLPTGWGLVGLALEYVGTIALTIAALVGIPAVPVGIVVGIRRAQAISRPITELADAADAIAEQRLDARVRVAGEDEIGTLGLRFNQMADRYQESLTREAAARAQAELLLAQSRDLVANVSHELRTPVALVRAHLEALAGSPEHLEDYTRIALRETDRLEALVNDLFQLARVESQGAALPREPFDAAGVVREATESLAEPARRDSGIALKTEVGPAGLRGLGDRARLVQVIQNLIRNAIRYTPEGGIILVAAHADGDRVAFSVRDTGQGIAPEDVPHVFDRFYRSEQSRNRSHGGAGLGLAIARQLIEAMGGEIGVESALGEGTVFTIRLPRQRLAPSAHPVAPAARAPRPVPVGTRR
jgi:signal transduction histidine kinase